MTSRDSRHPTVAREAARFRLQLSEKRESKYVSIVPPRDPTATCEERNLSRYCGRFLQRSFVRDCEQKTAVGKKRNRSSGCCLPFARKLYWRNCYADIPPLPPPFPELSVLERVRKDTTPTPLFPELLFSEGHGKLSPTHHCFRSFCPQKGMESNHLHTTVSEAFGSRRRFLSVEWAERKLVCSPRVRNPSGADTPLIQVKICS